MVERTLADYVRVLRARWRWVLVPLVLSLAFAAAYTYHGRDTYRSSIKLFVGQTAVSNLESGVQADTLAQRRVGSYADLLNGPRIGDLVEQRFGVRPVIDAQVIKDTVLIRVSVTDTQPVRARDIADFVGTSFIGLLNSLGPPGSSRAVSVPVTVVEPAAVPATPLRTPLLVNLGVGLLVGLIAGVGAALLRNSLDNTLRTSRDVESAFGVPVLGAVPTSQTMRTGLPVQDEPWSPASEAIRQVRTNVAFLSRERGQRLLVVTSALDQEGKTSVSLNLALALAMAGQRVVLVDADLRRRTIAEHLGLESPRGLAELLANHGRVEGFLQRWVGNGLEVLPSGEPPMNPSELLASSRMRQIVAALRDRADVVIFDAPALLASSDATVLSDLADGALVVVRGGRTTRTQLQAALDRLNMVGAPTVGFVLNFAAKRGPHRTQQSAARSRHALPSVSRRKRGPARQLAQGAFAHLEPHVVDVDLEERLFADTGPSTRGVTSTTRPLRED